MKVFIDTNIIISAMLFPCGKVALAYNKCVIENECIISEKVVYEIKEVISKKFPDMVNLIDTFIKMTTKTVKVVKEVKEKVGVEDTIRDINDIPIYRAAKKNKCDAILTGDKDFIENKKLDIDIITVDDILLCTNF